MSEQKIMQIVGAVDRKTGEETKTWWTRIGVAFQNRDGSFTLKFDYVPARIAETTIQLREMAPKEAQPSE